METNKLRIKINYNAILQYILIYILIQYIGGRVLAYLKTDIFYTFTLLICAAVIVIFPKIVPLEKSYFSFLIALTASMGLTFFITGGGLSIGTILSIISRFLIIFVAIRINEDRFINRFLNMTYVFAVISLIEFIFVIIVGEAVAISFFSHFTEIENGTGWLGSSYGLFFICYNFMHPFRNTYMFGEPGEYQILIIAALVFLSFYKCNISEKTKIRYYIVFVITLLTIQSTTGYINLIALIVAVFLSKGNKVSPKVKRILLIGIIFAAIYMFGWYSTDSFIYKNFISKVFTESGNVDLTVNTGAARIGPIIRFGQTLKNDFLKLIFGVGYDGLHSVSLKGYSTCGLINSIVMIGFISSFILYGKMIVSTIKQSNCWQQAALCIFIMINIGLSQPDILSIMSVLLCMYGACRKKRSHNYE